MEKFDTEKESLNFFVKKGVNSKVNKDSLMAVYFRNNPYEKMHVYEFPLIKEAKYKNSSLTKYEIPQYIKGIPEDFSAICTAKEAGIIKNIIRKEEREKKKKIQSDLEIKKTNSKEKENNALTSNNNKNSSKNAELFNDIKRKNMLEEPVPNDMHKYCHLCKKQFDNYIRHINSKGHKDTSLKYSNTFKSIHDIFNRINSFWNNKKEKEDNISKKNNIGKKSNELSEIEEKNEYENENVNEFDNLKKRMMSQLNKSIKEGCQAKRKLFINNSQLSTAQSSPMLSIEPLKRRKRSNVKKSKSKSKNNNRNLNEFLIRGEYANNKKKDKEEKVF